MDSLPNNPTNWRKQLTLVEKISFDAGYYEMMTQIRQSATNQMLLLCSNLRLKMRLSEAFNRLSEVTRLYIQAHAEFNGLLGCEMDDLTEEQGVKLIGDIEKNYVKLKWLKIDYEEAESDYYKISTEMRRNNRGC